MEFRNEVSTIVYNLCWKLVQQSVQETGDYFILKPDNVIYDPLSFFYQILEIVKSEFRGMFWEHWV